MPIRLWSTVVSQLATRPWYQGGLLTGTPLAATPASCDVARHVREQPVELRLAPAAADGRHEAWEVRLVAAVLEQRLQLGRVDEDRAARDRRAVAALARETVAVRADAGPLALPEAGFRALRDELLVGLLRLHDHARLHRRVEDAAELAALAAVLPELPRAEPRVVGHARDGVELAAERGNPPAVVDVLRVDVDLHDLTGGRVQLVDRDRAVRVRELPVELVRVDADVQRSTRGRPRRDVLDPRELVEDERDDAREDHDRDRCPDQLEPRGAVDLRAFRVARPPAAPVADAEDDH